MGARHACPPPDLPVEVHALSGEPFESPEWYRVADTLIALRGDIELSRHVYLGRSWYVLTDATGGKVHRITPAAHAFVGRLDGARSVETIWRLVVEELGEDAPTQGEIVRLLTQLYAADLLAAQERPLLDDLLERRDKEERQRLKKMFFNPVMATIPLIDPNRFLAVIARALSILPARAWWILAAAFIASALVKLPSNWIALSERGLEGLLDLENLVVIGLIYPVVKALHETGHGVAIRSRGGEVHEMGLMSIALYPIPYVEASASLAFPSKWARAAVAASGVVVELVIAAAAFHVWLLVEPGTLRTVAYNTMLIAGFSTVVVNGNPLLRYDGYHVLTDLIEIPNLGKRGNEYWGEILRVHLLGTVERNRAPVSAWERLWFVFYPPLAFVYRIFVSLTIAYVVALQYRFIGLLLAAWSIVLSVAWPAAKTAHKTFTDQRIRLAGPRAFRAGTGAVAAIGLALFVVPAPHNVVTQGIVWLPSEAFVRTNVSGLVEQVSVKQGDLVHAGDVLARLSSPERETEFLVSQARLRNLQAAYDASRFSDRAKAATVLSELNDARLAMQLAKVRLGQLVLKTAIDGEIAIEDTDALKGRFLKEGALSMNILPNEARTIRVVLRQDDIHLFRNRLRAVSVRFAYDPSHVYAATVVREVPAGDRALPSLALTIDGGGAIATVAGRDGTPEAAQRLFQFDVTLENAAALRPAFGMRTFVRLELEPLPIAWQAALRLRQLLAASFDV